MPLDQQELGQCDVLVVGGGPAGSTVATRLVELGFEVVLVEKDRHPRFHIGESLLPLNVPLFERLGVADAVKAIGMPKWGVDFTSPVHDRTVMFEFADAWDKRLPYSFQVRRSEFDHILLKNAAAKGVTVIEGCRVTALDLDQDDGVEAVAKDDAGQERRWRARFLVDASGRDTLVANRLGLKERNRRHASAAIYGHFTGARRQEGQAGGNISIFWFDHGWIWFIPLSDGTTSVGAVCPPEYVKSRTTDVTTFFQQTLAQSPQLTERIAGATLVGQATATGNYSYVSSAMRGRNYLLVGDAFAFIDPVFSTGVYLAMSSAFHAADAIATALRQPQEAERTLARFEANVRRALSRFSWFIYRMNRPALRDLFMNPRNLFRLQEAMLSLLSGDVFRPSPVHCRLTLFKGLYYAKAAQRKLIARAPRAA
ncbi:MAG TPA: NAD(P)/FAD-dependent oxidoreductase [Rhodopila sp.]|uniref:NAD(P)/FAD-dependent oxidoreductase n=1 Tax=Rhodopila sp. TaxID=2480087 RepID=UPI002B5C98AF|nr:NAD(P)/FAD-dependent oxidoreductase [Rhodopila sp.]HVY16329.1 NAD(P)/FAD-dependent oxidoreductase [Rhodopila sp.]